MLLKKWAPPKTIAATSAIFIWVNSMAGLAGAGASGQLNLEIEILTYFTIIVIIGGLIGSSYGAKIASQSLIRKFLIGILVIAAAKRLIELIIF